MKRYNIYSHPEAGIGFEVTEFKDGKWCLAEDHYAEIKKLEKKLEEYQDLYVQIETNQHEMLGALKEEWQFLEHFLGCQADIINSEWLVKISYRQDEIQKLTEKVARE